MNKRVVLSMVAILFLLVSTLGPTGTKVSAADSRLFPETGKTVTDPFLSYWNTHGGLAQQGYPITEAYQEKNDADGKTYLTQYFERARFEYHPENNDPRFQVLLGLLGKEVFQAKYGNNPPASSTQTVPGGDSRRFAETGKTVTGLFLDYWNTHGGLEQQGFPITEAYNEKNDADGKTYITQYFERARFEYHPESADPQYKVLLGLVGKEINSRKQNGGSGGTGGPSMWAGVTFPPSLPGAPFDAVAVLPPFGRYAGAAIFFKWPLFVFADTQMKQAAGPLPVIGTGYQGQANWPGLVLNSLDAVAVWGEGDKFYGRAHFFSGSKYIGYDLVRDLADGTPVVGLPEQYFGAQLTDIKALIPDFPFTSVDAVAVWNGPYAHTAYFFKGTQYARYDARTMKMPPGYPRSISQDFPSLPFSSVDEVAVWPNGKAYFFKGNEYVSYDIIAGKTDPGYPKPIK